MKKLIIPAVFLALLMSVLRMSAQNETDLLSLLQEEERTSVEALVLYPEKTRLSILEASKHPELLVKLESMQSRTSASFRSLMENRPREVQEAVWDLARYPGLVAKLSVATNDDLAGILDEYPTEIHRRATDAFYSNKYLLIEVARLDREWDATFRNLIKEYPYPVQDAVRELVELPEVLDILTDNIRMTVLVGDLYERRPEWLLQQLDSLNLEVARAKAKELDDWKKSLDENPQAKQELLSASESFAKEQGYDDIYYDYDDDYYTYPDQQERVIVERHYYHHYPYWYGYPYWYTFPRWRPYPWWWDWGFYWGPGRVIVFYDMPSYYFTQWYFFRSYNHFYYPYLSSHFVNHYYGHRYTGSSVSVTVNRWRIQNRNVITDEWLSNARTQPTFFREFGRFEEAREKHNNSRADKPLTQREFLEKNTRKYPELAKEMERSRSQERVERTAPEQPSREPRTAPEARQPDKKQPAPQRPRTEPEVKQPDRREPAPQRPKSEPRIEPPARQEPAPPRPRTEPSAPERRQPAQQPQRDIPKVDKAQDRHRSTWDQQRTEQRRTQPSTRPIEQPKSQPQQPQRTPPKGRGN